jgi:hypothetical protein
MLIDEVRKRFAINYYTWAKERLREEVAKDFPILQRISPALPVIEFLRGLSDHQQLVAISAFAKRGHAEAAKLAGEITSDEEALLLHRYMKFIDETTAKSNADVQNKVQRDFDRGKFVRDIHAEVGSMLGILVEKGGRLYRVYLLKFESCQIKTMIFAGGQSPQLQYWHTLLVHDGIVREHIAVLSWFGIIAGTTYWNPVSDNNSKSVIETFKEVCSIFIKAAPKLIEKQT